MKLYFTLAQIPELANLPARQRRFVYRAAYNQFCHEKRWSDIIRLSRTLLLVGTPLVLLDLVLRPLGVRYPLLVAVAIGCALGVVYSCALFERLRPYYRKYLSEHPNELGQTTKQA